MSWYEWVKDVFAHETLGFYLRQVAAIAAICVGAKVAIRLVRMSSARFFHNGGGRLHLAPGRAATLNALMNSVARYVIYFAAGVMILDRLGVPTASILATAGIGGLAVGFGAQNLVRDVITGFFILFENQYVVGDYVQLAGVSGIVEELGLRVTKIRDFGGQLHIVPNGSITQVTNFMGSAMRVMFDVHIAYEEDVGQANAVLEEVAASFASDPDIVEGPQVLGVTQFGESGIAITILARTKPMQQWAVERRLRRRIKEAFDEKGIEIPYPRRHIIMSSRKLQNPAVD